MTTSDDPKSPPKEHPRVGPTSSEGLGRHEGRGLSGGSDIHFLSSLNFRRGSVQAMSASDVVVATTNALRHDILPEVQALRSQLEEADNDTLHLLESGAVDPSGVRIRTLLPPDAVKVLAKAKLQDRATQAERGHDVNLAGMTNRGVVIAAVIALAATALGAFLAG
jgi:hypothetical protein